MNLAGDVAQSVDNWITMDGVYLNGVSTQTMSKSNTHTGDLTKCHFSATNCIFDVDDGVSYGAGNIIRGVGTYPNAKTKAQAIAAMNVGNGTKAHLARTLIEYPHLNRGLAEDFVAISLQAHGLQPVSFIPRGNVDMSGLAAPRAVGGDY
jgi:hypothetical protein